MNNDNANVMMLTPLQAALRSGLLSAGLLLGCAVLSFWAANTAMVVNGAPLRELVHHFWETHLKVNLGSRGIDMPLHAWVNDGLMAIFFFLVGLEIKREMLVGELASLKKAMLPAIAALGGMVGPALIYSAINLGGEGLRGWGIPMATDIAFAAGVIGLLGRRVHPSLGIFLVALAIVDDLGAVLVIAIFYTDTIRLEALLEGIALIGASSLLSFARVRSVLPYLMLALAAWLLFLESGVHATIVGVVFALTIPVKARRETPQFLARVQSLLERFGAADDAEQPRIVSSEQQQLVRRIEAECLYVEPPAQRIAYLLQPWCGLVIMPVFALANAGVTLEPGTGLGFLLHPVALGALLGLFLGKPLGIFLSSYAAVRYGLAELPAGMNWRNVVGLGFLGGIGFTMSLFVAQLAFGGAEGAVHLTEAKTGVLLASVCAAVVGSGWLLIAGKKTAE